VSRFHLHYAGRATTSNFIFIFNSNPTPPTTIWTAHFHPTAGMPLITTAYPVHAHQQNLPSTLAKSEQQLNDYNDFYDDFETRDEDEEDMSDTSPMISRPHQKKQKRRSPTVPEKSDLRASRILESLSLEIKSLQQAAMEGLKDHHISTISSLSDPHESYLSSEEDASESADDYDESFLEFEADLDLELHPTSSNISRRSSREDTARAVSVIFVGKPQLVDIFAHERPQTAVSRSRPTPLRLNSVPTYPPSPSTSSFRNSFVMSNASETATNFTQRQKRSAISALSSLSTNIKTRAASASHFLTSDPFPTAPNPDYCTLSAEDQESAHMVAPKTPTSLANAAWKGGMKGVSRKLSIVKRRPSMPKLSHTYAAGNRSATALSPPSQSTSTTPDLPSFHNPFQAPPRASTDLAGNRSNVNFSAAWREQEATAPAKQSGPVRYEDIMRNVVYTPPPMSTSGENEKESKTRGSLLGLGIRRLGRAGGN
jgi:hypothetical protein